MSLAGFFNFLLVFKSRDYKLCQKIDKTFLRPILMKLGMVLEVNETFTTIWLSRSSEVRSRSGDDLSPLLGLFFTKRLCGLGHKS